MQDHVSLASFVAAFGAGVVSVLSPCVLPLMPAYLSLLSGVSVEALSDANARAAVRGRVLRGCAGFVAGFSTIFVLLGASATMVGRRTSFVRSRTASTHSTKPGTATTAPSYRR